MKKLTLSYDMVWYNILLCYNCIIVLTFSCMYRYAKDI